MQHFFDKKTDNIIIYLVVYVDDLFMTGSDENTIQDAKQQLK